MAEIQVLIPQQTYSPGDALCGEIVIRTQKKLKCKNVLAKLQCFAHGYGNNASKEIAKLSVFQGELPPGTHRFSFEFMMPAGPYSYQGHYTNLEWGVQGYVDIPWAIDKKTTEHFTLSSAHIPSHLAEQVPAQPDAHKNGQGLIPLVIGSGVMGLGVVLGVVALASDTVIAIIAIALLVIGGIVFAIGLRSFLAARVITTPHITIEPWPLRLGQSAQYTLTFTPGTYLNLNSASLKLVCKEIVVRGSGTDATTHTHEVHSEVYNLTAGSSHQKGQPVTLTQAVTLPAHLPTSFTLPSNKVVWELHTHIDIPNWPDWKDSHAVHVCPRRGDEAKEQPTVSSPGPSW